MIVNFESEVPTSSMEVQSYESLRDLAKGYGKFLQWVDLGEKVFVFLEVNRSQFSILLEKSSSEFSLFLTDTYPRSRRQIVHTNTRRIISRTNETVTLGLCAQRPVSGTIVDLSTNTITLTNGDILVDSLTVGVLKNRYSIEVTDNSIYRVGERIRIRETNKQDTITYVESLSGTTTVNLTSALKDSYSTAAIVEEYVVCRNCWVNVNSTTDVFEVVDQDQLVLTLGTTQDLTTLTSIGNTVKLGQEYIYLHGLTLGSDRDVHVLSKLKAKHCFSTSSIEEIASMYFRGDMQVDIYDYLIHGTEDEYLYLYGLDYRNRDPDLSVTIYATIYY